MVDDKGWGGLKNPEQMYGIISERATYMGGSENTSQPSFFKYILQLNHAIFLIILTHTSPTISNYLNKKCFSKVIKYSTLMTGVYMAEASNSTWMEENCALDFKQIV